MRSEDAHPTLVAVLRPMTGPEFASWRAETVPTYAADKVVSGQWLPEAALELSQREYEALLPTGQDTPDNHFFTIVDAGSAAVGMLWFAVKPRGAERIAYVYDVSVVETRQREGHALRAFLALEDKVRRRGLAGIALHVFGHNVGAQALYARLGFRPTSISLYKPIDGAVLPPT